MADIPKSEHFTNFRNGMVGGGKQRVRIIDAIFIEIVGDRHAYMFFECIA